MFGFKGQGDVQRAAALLVQGALGQHGVVHPGASEQGETLSVWANRTVPRHILSCAVCAVQAAFSPRHPLSGPSVQQWGSALWEEHFFTNRLSGFRPLCTKETWVDLK